MPTASTPDDHPSPSATTPDAAETEPAERGAPEPVRDTIASVPFMLGHTPRSRLIVVTTRTAMSGVPERPVRQDRVSGLDADIDVLRCVPPSTLAERLVHLLPWPLPLAESVLLLLVGPGPAAWRGTDLPLASSMRELAEAFERGGAAATRAVFTPRIARGVRWRDYRDPLTSGRLPDPHETPLGQRMTRAGHALADGHAAVQDRFATAPIDEHCRVASMVEHAIMRLVDQSHIDPDAVQRQCLDLVDKAVQSTLDGDMPTGDEDRASLLAALTLPGIAESHLAPRTPRDVPAIEQLWFTLLRVAHTASHRDSLHLLIAYSAYLRGDRTLASVAAGRVQEPSTVQALLALALTRGLPPHALRRAVTRAATAFRTAITGHR